jgi:hypothetical protein
LNIIPSELAEGAEMNQNQQIENVARAFHSVEGDHAPWEEEPERLKSEFRDLARAAIAMLQGPKQEAEAASHHVA